MTTPATATWDFPFQRPVLPPVSAWSHLLDSAYAAHWFSNHGQLARTLEARLAQRCGRAVALASNGTAAITAALLALGREGAVVLPSFTFPATLSAVQQAGLQPVLADVDARTWELDVPNVEAALVGHAGPVAAVLAVRAFGLCREHPDLVTWCQIRRIPLVFDSAAALGGRLPDGRPAGCEGTMETFSMHATKVFAVGEGGAISCDPHWMPALRRVTNFGLENGVLQGSGFNGKMSEFTAAIGLVQDAAFDDQLSVRRAAAKRYMDFFSTQAPEWMVAAEPGDPPWQGFPLLAPDADKATRLLERCAQRGVQLRRYYNPALHTAAVAASYANHPLEVSASLARRMVCLPMYSDMSAEEQGRLLERVADSLRSV
jgi:dTDP-4-amino-4,6-dideoxygalactose transaminase